jgi:cyclohexadienyl dehydratase
VNAMKSARTIAWWSLGISSLALVLAGVSLRRVPPSGSASVARQEGILDRIARTSELHAGYGGYAPYTMEDPNTQKVSGYSVDIVERIAKELGAKVVWHRLNWNTMSADLKRGEFDVIADPIFQTIPRARELAFSEPYAYFADGIAVVRINDNRFSSFESLDRKGITINVGLGRGSEELVRSRFTNATISPIPASTDEMIVFEDVLAGRSDVAVADLPNALRIVKEHSGKLKALFVDHPPAYMPAGFALRPSDVAGAEFFSVAIRNLRSTGILADLAKKYALPATDTMK